MLEIGSRRELFWDEYLIDCERTTAKLTLHHMTKRDMVMDFHMPWEGDACGYWNTIKVDGTYRMYYGAGRVEKAGDSISRRICFIESLDGIHWTRPNLGLHEFNGNKENNIILVRKETMEFDNFFVFIDRNPLCPADEKFKGIGEIENKSKPFPAERELWCYTSPDGIRFKKNFLVTDGGVKNGGIFDSLNTAYWDESDQKYKMYVRGIHDKSVIRDIRYMESADFRQWSEPVLLQFPEGTDDYPLYTNCISRYYRAPHMLVGFPMRYTERREWTKNFDQLCGEEGASRRKVIMEDLRRGALTTTDCIFMTSRDGVSWRRFDEAFLTPGIERKINWIYGNCSVSHGLLETESPYESEPPEISMFAAEGRRWGVSERLYRYAIRQDGFASYRADYRPAELYTKPFIFAGSRLRINFSTSARGYLFITLLDRFGKPIEGFESCELFGDSLNRTVVFRDGADVSSLAGETVRMRIVMSDADIYSFVFEQE